MRESISVVRFFFQAGIEVLSFAETAGDDLLPRSIGVALPLDDYSHCGASRGRWRNRHEQFRRRTRVDDGRVRGRQISAFGAPEKDPNRGGNHALIKAVSRDRLQLMPATSRLPDELQRRARARSQDEPVTE